MLKNWYKASSPRIADVSLSLLIAASLLAGCSGSQSAAPNGKEQEKQVGNKKQEEHQPVTISVGVRYLSDDEVKRYIIDPVKLKYPWITVKAESYKPENLPNIVAAGEVPDIFITNNVSGLPAFENLKLLASIDDLIKTQGMDLSRFEPEALAAVKMAVGKDYLIGIPYTRNFSALYYNKNIFNKFGVAYPKDGMTWSEYAELAKRVTRNDGGIQYRGLEPNVPKRVGAQLSLPLVDPKTNRAALNTEQWKKVLTQMRDIYKIPGNEKMAFQGDGEKLFYKEQSLAMFADVNLLTKAELNQNPEFWDIASFPVWPEAPRAGMGIDEHLMLLASTSKHREDAFRVMSAVVSDEVQLDMNKQAKLGVMKDAKFKTAFGENAPFLKGKNVQAIFKTDVAKPYVPTLYDTIATGEIQNQLVLMVETGKDVNSAVRDAEEAVNKKIQESINK